MREAEELLKRAGIRGSLDQTSHGACDAARYELTIIDGNEANRIVAHDATVLPELLPLIELLLERSRPVPPKKRGAVPDASKKLEDKHIIEAQSES
jgi:hypothetical protein